ncbi:LPS export ABC transporter periplasmic protein LptC [Bartonella rattaustraliani]|uniref:LPS export ABC transporter periplasmic protein LptC n=1 Tax=Bartonella rattaustraliani TaxID=481139 RepID=UPI000315A801|nr:LPS export ABC transporter periplasmic protein LptC [Bartonella rattaustraliani]
MVIHNRYELFSVKSSFGDIFKKASRHSRYISVLKFFLPLVALVIALVFCWFTFFFVPTASNPTTLSENEEREIMKLTMLNPKLEGYTRSHEPYWFKAEKAFQDHIRSGVIGLQNITAEAFIGKRKRVFLDAQEGIYDNMSSCLQLNEPFTITINDGTIVQFIAANINLSEGQLDTNQRVNIQRAGLRLSANALQIREKGQNMYFHGGVHLIFDKK